MEDRLEKVPFARVLAVEQLEQLEQKKKIERQIKVTSLRIATIASINMRDERRERRKGSGEREETLANEKKARGENRRYVRDASLPGH